MTDDTLSKELLRAAGEGACKGLGQVAVFVALGVLVWATNRKKVDRSEKTGERAQLEGTKQ